MESLRTNVAKAVRKIDIASVCVRTDVSALRSAEQNNGANEASSFGFSLFIFETFVGVIFLDYHMLGLSRDHKLNI